MVILVSDEYGQIRSPACPQTEEIKDKRSPSSGPPAGYLHLHRNPSFHHFKDG